MATNLHLEDRLIEKARTLGRHRTKREAVTRALEDYIRRLEQEKITTLFGAVEYDPAYDHKKQRARG